VSRSRPQPEPAARREPGDHAVDTPIICTLTRFRFRSPLQLAAAYRHYRRVVREARERETPGLLQCAFLVENPVTWYSVSIWSDPAAIAHFGTNVPEHVHAARRFFPRVVFGPEPEVWSTKWRLSSVSHNLNWGDFDLRGAIAQSEG
jgi:hypothetical protein